MKNFINTILCILMAIVILTGIGYMPKPNVDIDDDDAIIIQTPSNPESVDCDNIEGPGDDEDFEYFDW